MKQFVVLIVLAACSASETPAPPPPVPVAADLSWRDRVTAELTALDAKTRAELMAVAPAAATHDPRLAAVFLDRLARKTDEEPVRVALVEALRATGGTYEDALADLFADEPSAKVRVALVRAAPTTFAVLRRAFSDPALEVRIAAARSAATHPTCAQLAGELRTALADREPTLRTEAARSIGLLKIDPARDELVRALGDTDPDVRLEALRALDRIAPGSLAGTTAVIALRDDPDARVAALAQQLAARP